MINTDKTEIMVNDLDNEITLDAEGKDIKTVSKAAYLGVHLKSHREIQSRFM